MNRHVRLILAAVLASLAFALGPAHLARAQIETAASRPRIFEIRTYTTEPGRLDALQARFRDHTTKLFEKHGMTNIGYWTPADEPLSKNTLIYILAHSSREAAKQSWEAFINDPEWHKARDDSEKDGPIVNKVESVFLEPTDYSPIK